MPNQLHSGLRFRFAELSLSAVLASGAGSVAAELPEDAAHFWWARIPSEEYPQLVATLSIDELERATRFHFPAPRIEYVATRYMLRSLLSGYLGRPAESLAFAYNSKGKPHLPADPQLGFSVSHSYGLAAFGFARNRSVGVDVEKIHTDRPVMDIADRFFSQAERQALHTLPEDQRHAAFFRIWTRKEAYIKALGEGLSHGLGQFDTSLKSGDENALLATRPDPAEALRWRIRDAEVLPAYAAAMAVSLQ